jgi:hypothetical protein
MSTFYSFFHRGSPTQRYLSSPATRYSSEYPTSMYSGSTASSKAESAHNPFPSAHYSPPTSGVEYPHHPPLHSGRKASSGAQSDYNHFSAKSYTSEYPPSMYSSSTASSGGDLAYSHFPSPQHSPPNGYSSPYTPSMYSGSTLSSGGKSTLSPFPGTTNLDTPAKRHGSTSKFIGVGPNSHNYYDDDSYEPMYAQPQGSHQEDTFGLDEF